MKFIESELPGVLLLEPTVYRDDRGYFLETYQKEEFQKAGIKEEFVQHNFSLSIKNTLRGLHLQTRHLQGKLVRVIRGEALDVVVDVRQGSPTYKKWVSFKINDKNLQQIYIPPGMAHGFLALTDEVEFEYKCTDFYDKDSQLSILWNDPDLKIPWLIKNPLMSDKDKKAPLLKDIVDQLPFFRT
jgi:dTDP-4-dehydrorhamnose 3,5-epimerase